LSKTVRGGKKRLRKSSNFWTEYRGDPFSLMKQRNSGPATKFMVSGVLKRITLCMGRKKDGKKGQNKWRKGFKF
jgi:hypothetical protein